MEETFWINEDEDVSVEVSILHDEESYRVWEDCDGAMVDTFEGRRPFWAAAERYGIDERDIGALVSGKVVASNGKLFLGLERYRHSGDVYALCREGGFPDRQWDVSPIVGWIIPHPEIDADVIKAYNDNGDPFLLKERMRSELESFNDAISGNCWGYRVVLYDGPDEINDDSCWGFLGDTEYCKEQAKSSAEYMLKHYKPNYDICPHCGSRVKKDK